MLVLKIEIEKALFSKSKFRVSALTDLFILLNFSKFSKFEIYHRIFCKYPREPKDVEVVFWSITSYFLYNKIIRVNTCRLAANMLIITALNKPP